MRLEHICVFRQDVSSCLQQGNRDFFSAKILGLYIAVSFDLFVFKVGKRFRPSITASRFGKNTF